MVAADVSGPEVVEADHLVTEEGGDDGLEAVELLGRERLVDEAAGRVEQDPDPAGRDRRGDHQSGERVDPGGAGQGDQRERDEHAERDEGVRAEVDRRRIERGRAGRPAGPGEVGRDEEVGRGREAGDDHPDPDGSDLPTVEESSDRLVGDEGRAQQEQQGLGAGGEVLELLVTVPVARVGRLVGLSHRGERDHRGEQIHQRVGRVAEDPDRPGHQARGDLERDQARVRDDRDDRRPGFGACVGRLGGHRRSVGRGSSRSFVDPKRSSGTVRSVPPACGVRSSLYSRRHGSSRDWVDTQERGEGGGGFGDSPTGSRTPRSSAHCRRGGRGRKSPSRSGSPGRQEEQGRGAGKRGEAEMSRTGSTQRGGERRRLGSATARPSRLLLITAARSDGARGGGDTTAVARSSWRPIAASRPSASRWATSARRGGTTAGRRRDSPLRRSGRSNAPFDAQARGDRTVTAAHLSSGSTREIGTVGAVEAAGRRVSCLGKRCLISCRYRGLRPP